MKVQNSFQTLQALKVYAIWMRARFKEKNLIRLEKKKPYVVAQGDLDQIISLQKNSFKKRIFVCYQIYPKIQEKSPEKSIGFLWRPSVKN